MGKMDQVTLRTRVVTEEFEYRGSVNVRKGYYVLVYDARECVNWTNISDPQIISLKYL